MALGISTDIYLDANATTRVLPTAADVFRRVGVENAWHIAGGLALGSRSNGVSADSADPDCMI